MNLSLLIPPAMVKQGKVIRAAVNRLERELNKGIQLDLTAFTTKLPVRPSRRTNKAV